jgi:hypothetical protein
MEKVIKEIGHTHRVILSVSGALAWSTGGEALAAWCPVRVVRFSGTTAKETTV